MELPRVIEGESFQIAWAKAINALKDSKWELWSLVVRIKNPSSYDDAIQEKLCDFSTRHEYISPRDIEHTIFPTRLYRKYPEKRKLYRAYHKYFVLTRDMPHSGWGTYFNSMTNYPTSKGKVDQLGDMIEKIKARSKIYGAANVIIIPEPYRDRNKQLGAPCLNYITVQVEKDTSCLNNRRISLLCVYRNHDFTVRAYGNYLGLCRLLEYICTETESTLGSLTCISSHATVPAEKSELKQIANEILEICNG